MRTAISLMAFVASATAVPAQFDVNRMIEERLAQLGQDEQPVEGLIIADDDGPFVPNNFIGSFRLELHSFVGDSERTDSPKEFLYWSNADMTALQLNVTDAQGAPHPIKVITDLTNKWQYILMSDPSDKKIAVRKRKKKVTVVDAPDDVATRTTEMRTINGFKCTKTVVVTKEGTWTGWTTDGIPPPFEDMIGNMKPNSLSARSLIKYKNVTSFPIEYEWSDKEGKERIKGYVRDIKLGSVPDDAFSRQGYELIEQPAKGR